MVGLSRSSILGVTSWSMCPVQAFPPNGFELYSMTGNTWEWCADWFGSERSFLLRQVQSAGAADRGRPGTERRLISLSQILLQPLPSGGPVFEHTTAQRLPT